MSAAPSIDPLGAPFAADELAGQICLVTGAAQGIGAAVCARLAEHGARVAVTDLDAAGAERVAERLRSAGGDAVASALDVRDTATIDRVLGAVERDWGPLDALVNNAGMCVVRPTVEIPDDEWAQHADVMLTGPFKLARRAAPAMLARGRGAIVNVCSISAYGGWPQRAAYNAAKAGLVAFTEATAVEWADRGVRVNGIAPAVTRTEITAAVLERAGGAISMDDFEGRTPMGRLAEAVEMADAILFLISSRSAFVTGQVLPVDGGWLRSDGFEGPDA